MNAGLERRIRALETQAGCQALDLSHLTDRELITRILRIELGHEPSADEIDEQLALPPAEAQRQNQERLASLRRQLAQL
jgi:hypothetical protein